MNLLEKFGNEYATLNFTPGKKVYREFFKEKGGKEYRNWDPYRSKLGAALVRGLGKFPFKEESVVLYLGAANGTTVSHISDICPKGIIYAVEMSPRPMIDLFSICKQRKNIAPILADANFPEDYAERVSKADILYEDIAQKYQVEIFKKNAELFLKPGGIGFLMVKARSIDVTMQPNQVFSIVLAQLQNSFKIIEQIQLDPFEKDHMCIVIQN